MRTYRWTDADGNIIDFKKPLYRVHEVWGVSDIKTTVQTQKAPFQDGETFIDALLDVRQIGIRLTVTADSQNDLQDARRNLIRLLNPKKGEGIFRCLTEEGDAYSIAAIPDNSPAAMGKLGEGEAVKQQVFSLNWLACDPLWYSAAQIVTLSASFTANNAGDETTPIELMIEADGADVVKPKITNTDTGEYIELDYTIADGEEVYINTDFGKKEITLVSDDTNLFNKLTSASTMFSLPAGTSNLTYTLTSGGRAGELRFYPRHLGV
jgi:hypothetical protein